MSRLSDPISVIAHQLKNPIAVIKEYLEILKSGDLGKLNDKQKEYITDAFKNIEQTQKIIGNLLDVSRVEGGVYKIEKKSVDLSKIIQGVVEEFKFFARSFNCEIILENFRQIPKVYTDPEKIREVIENFISNAIRYKPIGHGKIELSLKKVKDRVIFGCKDNGAGIPISDKKRIFSKFFRTAKAMEIEPNGTGLGLYINKAIIEKSGGKIWFKSNEKKGTTFYFSLPTKKQK